MFLYLPRPCSYSNLLSVAVPNLYPCDILAGVEGAIGRAHWSFFLGAGNFSRSISCSGSGTGTYSGSRDSIGCSGSSVCAVSSSSVVGISGICWKTGLIVVVAGAYSVESSPDF